MNLYRLESRMRRDGYSDEHIERVVDDYVDRWIEDQKDRELIERREAPTKGETSCPDQ